MKYGNKKIWFTGAQGTGKSEQVRYFLSEINHSIEQHPKYSSPMSERRFLQEKGVIKINKDATPWDEIILAGDAMLSFISTSAPFISDRSWVCKCAYSQALPFSQELLDAWHTINTLSFPGVGENENYFYFPPMLPIEDDGVRSTDPEYQKEIDYWIQFYLDYFQIPFHTIESYSVQDRHLEIVQKVFGKI